jgi:hypothetical protein
MFCGGRINNLDKGAYRLRWQVLAFDGTSQEVGDSILGNSSETVIGPLLDLFDFLSVLFRGRRSRFPVDDARRRGIRRVGSQGFRLSANGEGAPRVLPATTLLVRGRFSVVSICAIWRCGAGILAGTAQLGLGEIAGRISFSPGAAVCVPIRRDVAITVTGGASVRNGSYWRCPIAGLAVLVAT